MRPRSARIARDPFKQWRPYTYALSETFRNQSWSLSVFLNQYMYTSAMTIMLKTRTKNKSCIKLEASQNQKNVTFHWIIHPVKESNFHKTLRSSARVESCHSSRSGITRRTLSMRTSYPEKKKQVLNHICKLVTETWSELTSVMSRPCPVGRRFQRQKSNIAYVDGKYYMIFFIDLFRSGRLNNYVRVRALLV